MTLEARCSEVYTALRTAGLPCLVLGGHAVRFYGIDRNTMDHDLVIAPERWANLSEIVKRSFASGETPVHEGPSWRPADFRRFVIGTLADGREERLECWRRNHLLAPFVELRSRRREGVYGGATVAFLGLDDLIRSKETEREDDWRDAALLEEIADEERLRLARESGADLALTRLRSRRGFATALALGLLGDAAAVARASAAASHPVTLAYLLPFLASAPAGVALQEVFPAIREIIEGPLRRVTPGSSRHIALVEAVRRLYKREAMALDRADKLRAAAQRDA